MQKVILIDNYDSFTYNLYQYFCELGARVSVYKNDEISLEQLKEMDFSHLVISPGPGNPTIDSDFGVCKEAITYFFKKKPILGVCLGHQGIIALSGGKVIDAKVIMHGMRSVVRQSGNSKLLSGLSVEFEVMRYHSLVIDEKSFPMDFRIIARAVDDGAIMGFEHKDLPVYGVQFHPESIGTPDGLRIISNFLHT